MGMMVGTLTPLQYRKQIPLNASPRTVPLLLAILVSATIAAIGWRLSALTGAGALAATGVGATILAATGWPGFLALGAFFAGSSLVSRLAPDRGAAFDAKGQRRDPWQVLANGGPAALGALVPEAGLWIATAGLAASAADTWATSVGAWSRVNPRHILTGRIVDPGSNGGVTILGTVGAMAGAVSVAAGPALLAGEAALFPATLTVGMLGMLLDSFLGALLQGRFHCDRCDRPTERRTHRCGTDARLTGGLAWLSNDGVNALASGAATVAGFMAWRVWGG
jgi:uncharacterized protein (TIGR00297 family)